MRDALKHEPAGSGVAQIDDVVHGAAEQVDVLAVERRNEGLVEPAENLMGDFVAVCSMALMLCTCSGTAV